MTIQPKTIGVLGGLGPDTTAEFYLNTISASLHVQKITRPPMLIWNVPMDYQLEKEFLIKAKNQERLLPYLTDGAKHLENGGSDFIVIPCNTVHVFIKDIRKAVSIPVLSIIEETVNKLKKDKVKIVGLLGTSITIKNNLYNDLLKERAIDMSIPSPEDQHTINAIINNLVNRKKMKRDEMALRTIIQKFSSQNIHSVLLACTDLQLLIHTMPHAKVYDTMQILSEATVLYMHRKS